MTRTRCHATNPVRETRRQSNSTPQGEPSTPSVDPAPGRKNPLPHQSEALNDILPALRQPGSDVRAQGIMACGTGKTLVGTWAAEELGPRTLLTEPSLALVAQNVREWRANVRRELPEYLVVCSDQSVVRPNADEVVIRPEELGMRVTSSAHEVAAFLRGTSGRKLLVSTPHSTPIVAAAMRRTGVPGFDCTVVDEAHRTAVREESVFGVVLDQAEIRSRTRLFLTATPRIYHENDRGADDVVSMSDEKVYGPRAHTLSFRRAIERRLLCDYQVVVPLLWKDQHPGPAHCDSCRTCGHVWFRLLNHEEAVKARQVAAALGLLWSPRLNSPCQTG
jgi:predicted helicase